MSNENLYFTLPPGRLVGGDVYEGKTRTDDKTGQPKLIAKGQNAGKPVIEFYTPYAIVKTKANWRDEPWAAPYVAHMAQQWPSGQSTRRDFAAKITDGDDTEPNKNMKRACDRDGYPGHWVLQLAGLNAPQIVNENGTRPLPIEEYKIQPGDVIQANIKASSNQSKDSPGMYIEARVIAFQRSGPRIVTGDVDASTLGFGGAALPVYEEGPGMQQGVTNENRDAAPPPQTGTPAPPPRTEFSAGAGAPPPPPEAPDRLTQKARDAGAKTEADVLAWNGWTEDALIKHGYLTA
jgi:hypothetical protein